MEHIIKIYDVILFVAISILILFAVTVVCIMLIDVAKDILEDWGWK